MPLGPRGEADVTGPIVTLTTDFGLADAFVGLVKAGILARCPTARIVDLTHLLPSYGIEAGAFWIERSFRSFPPGTVHLGVVDPGVGTPRRIVLVQQAGQLFLGPDNGLLGPIAGLAGAVVRAVTPDFLQSEGITELSPTFHGRDLFAPLVGLLAQGTRVPQEVGPVIGDWQRSPGPGPAQSAGRIRGRVLIIDKFGNCFSDIRSELLVERKDLEGFVADRRLPWVRTYGDRPDGSLVALVNAFGVVEVACVGGHAARALGLQPGDPVEVRYADP